MPRTDLSGYDKTAALCRLMADQWGVPSSPWFDGELFKELAVQRGFKRGLASAILLVLRRYTSLLNVRYNYDDLSNPTREYQIDYARCQGENEPLWRTLAVMVKWVTQLRGVLNEEDMEKEEENGA